jgi:hypothetical protein
LKQKAVIIPKAFQDATKPKQNLQDKKQLSTCSKSHSFVKVRALLYIVIFLLF